MDRSTRTSLPWFAQRKLEGPDRIRVSQPKFIRFLPIAVQVSFLWPVYGRTSKGNGYGRTWRYDKFTSFEPKKTKNSQDNPYDARPISHERQKEECNARYPNTTSPRAWIWCSSSGRLSNT